MAPWRQAVSDILGTTNRDARESEAAHTDESANGQTLIELLDHDVDEYRIGDLAGGTQAAIKVHGDRQILVIDTDEIPEEELLEASDSFKATFESQNGFALEIGSSISSAIKQQGSGGLLDTVCDFYQGKVPNRYNPMIREAMVLRIAEEEKDLSRPEVRRRKYQMKRNYGNEAYAVASLCSAGYLDQGHLLWETYNQLVKNGAYSVEEYAEIFDTLVPEKPFVVFVKGEDHHTDVYDEVVGKSIRLNNYKIDISFIDIRGKGTDTRDIMDDTLAYFHEHHSSLRYTEEENGDQYIIRLNPDSI